VNETTRIYWLHALTPLHVGVGSGLGYIDLPIMREKVTNWPLVPGSAVKGVLRDWHEEKKTDYLDIAFGKAGDEHANSGSLVFTDSRIVCLPIRSLYGTFAWCTSPLVLNRLVRDLKAAGITQPDCLVAEPGESQAWTPKETKIKLEGAEEKIYLEDLDLDRQEHADAETWAEFIGDSLFSDERWKSVFKERFVILSDKVFDFLCETGTEVNARVRIEDDKKTVARGALWYEEALPAETILCGMVWCDRIFGNNGTKIESKGLLDTYCTSVPNLQIGGKATIGHGRVRCVFSEGGNQE
jgi:CRISPR-associated protein Cmr4